MGDQVSRSGPAGGVQLQRRAVRRWRWDARGDLVSAPVRCRREQWYLARGVPGDAAVPETADVIFRFLARGRPVGRRCVRLAALEAAGAAPALLGWLLTPEDATHFELRLPERGSARRLAGLVLHPVAERDPKSHPLANVPHWSAYAPPLTIERVVLPASLESLADHLAGVRVEVLASPRSARKLAARAAGTACVLDPAWIATLGLRLEDLERLAGVACVVVDLETFAGLMRQVGAVPLRCVTHAAEHEIMSARVEYADAATRGFAMQDVFPLASLTPEGAFATRVLRATGAWKRYADATGFAALLTSETPWERKCGDILTAARPVRRGELIVSDLPQLVAGRRGPLLAPRLAAHALRMHLGLPLADGVQYWNRWQYCDVLVRDISEIARRHPPLRSFRWCDADDGCARLGVALTAGENRSRPAKKARRTLLIRTGRIDMLDAHDGVAPEPMLVFMKWLAREQREQTRWAARWLADTTVIWQFDTADGLKYALAYESAAGLPPAPITHTLRLRTDALAADGPRWRLRRTSGRSAAAIVPADAGIFGDRSLDFQAALTALLRRWIERPHAR